jgi:hypothetical protein
MTWRLLSSRRAEQCLTICTLRLSSLKITAPQASQRRSVKLCCFLAWFLIFLLFENRSEHKISKQEMVFFLGRCRVGRGCDGWPTWSRESCSLHPLGEPSSQLKYSEVEMGEDIAKVFGGETRLTVIEVLKNCGNGVLTRWRAVWIVRRNSFWMVVS